MGSFCPNCSAENDAGARFCRKCGARLYPQDLHEASTRDLPPEGAGTSPGPQPRSTGHVDRVETASPPAGFTPAPHYVPPQAGPVAAPYPGGVPAPRKGRSWPVILLATFAGLVLLCGAGGFFIYSAVKKAAEESGVSIEGGKVKVKPPDGGVTFVANADPEDLSEADRKWYYPNADIAMYTSGGDQGEQGMTMIMSSSDTIETIVAHYKTLMGESVQVNDIRDNADRVVTLSAESQSVTIHEDPGARQRQIIVAAGEDGSGMGRPEIPGGDYEPPGVDVPEPPEPPSVPPPRPPSR